MQLAFEEPFPYLPTCGSEIHPQWLAWVDCYHGRTHLQAELTPPSHLASGAGRWLLLQNLDTHSCGVAQPRAGLLLPLGCRASPASPQIHTALQPISAEMRGLTSAVCDHHSLDFKSHVRNGPKRGHLWGGMNTPALVWSQRAFLPTYVPQFPYLNHLPKNNIVLSE